MRFDIITLMPGLFQEFLKLGITGRAIQSGNPDIRLVDLRDFGIGKHRRVDDTVYGGGPGMLLMAEPLAQCVDSIKKDRANKNDDNAPVILFSPAGKKLEQATLNKWADSDGAILICGRYEGIDQRFIDKYVDEEISLGDYVLSGGDPAAIVFLDGITRLLPGAIQGENSAEMESFRDENDFLLDYPQYTKPSEWNSEPVPEELKNGDHGKITEWRRKHSLKITSIRRPDLIEKARTLNKLTPEDESFLKKLNQKS